MEAPLHCLIFGGLLQPALRFDAYPLTPLAEKPATSAAFIIPTILVPCLSVPATSLIRKIGSLSPYCFDIVAKQAAPQSVSSCCLTQ